MTELDGVKLKPGYSEADVVAAAAKKLRVSADCIEKAEMRRLSLDARKKSDIHYVARIAVRLKSGTVYKKEPKPQAPPYSFPFRNIKSPKRPVVAGSGPAGIFCAFALAEAGLRPILIEQGKAVEERVRDVRDFFESGRLNPLSNVQFGEGGAGTFSDGKLYTGTKDIRGRYVLEKYAQAGAPKDILYLSAPHIGTDRLRGVAAGLRAMLVSLGGEVRFSCRLTDIYSKDGKLRAVGVGQNGAAHTIDTDTLVLAVGHSARDTFAMLHGRGIELAQKPFAAGVRIEHPQSAIDTAQYGSMADFKSLPAASYKLVHHCKNGRGAYTFCVCPGGQVVAAASEENMLVTNGMSNYVRDGKNCNGALLVGVNTEDFGGDHPLAGIDFQRKMEAEAFRLGGGGYIAPAQLAGDFIKGRPSDSAGSVVPGYRPGVVFTDIAKCLPDFITAALREALPELGKKITGFDMPDAVLTAVESRSSSPVRILRDKCGQSSLGGVFPCGEGAGYAGGILSAAVDGIKCAEHICGRL